jgi:hypothetical protein
MNKYIIKALPFGDYGYMDCSLASDEYGKIYFLEYPRWYTSKNRLFVCDPEVNVWQTYRLECSLYRVELVCVRKGLLYIIHYIKLVGNFLSSVCIKTSKVETLAQIDVEFLDHFYPYYRYWQFCNEEIRVFKIQNKLLLNHYRAFDLQDNRWKTINLNVYFNFNRCCKICVWDDYVYVHQRNSINKYHAESGYLQWYIQRKSKQVATYDLFKVSGHVCYLDDRMNIVVFKDQDVYRNFNGDKIRFGFNIHKIVEIGDKLYVFKLYISKKNPPFYLALGCLSFKVSSLKEIAMRKVAAHLNVQTTYDELSKEIGRLALYFRPY